MIPVYIADLATVLAALDNRLDYTETDVQQAYAITNAMAQQGWSWSDHEKGA